MLLKKSQWPIFIFTAIYLLVFLFVFFGRRNYEFLGYIGVIVAVLLLIIFTNKRVNYPDFVLWGLSIWGLLHMMGGGVIVKDGNILYTLILIPISQSYEIFKYDQFVHIIGFGVATLLMWVLLKNKLKLLKNWTAISIVVIMAGLGVGAVNEIIEFTATVFIEETNVGGYINTSLDLVADLIGAILAMIYIRIKNGKI